MPSTKGQVLASGDEKLPFKVVFSTGKTVIAEYNVNSVLSGEELIERLLPTLQGFSPNA